MVWLTHGVSVGHQSTDWLLIRVQSWSLSDPTSDTNVAFWGLSVHSPGYRGGYPIANTLYLAVRGFVQRPAGHTMSRVRINDGLTYNSRLMMMMIDDVARTRGVTVVLTPPG